jgi:flagellar biosynthesis/type III secretory pathway protein FliH
MFVEVRDNKIAFRNPKNKDLFAILKIIYDNNTNRKEKRKQLERYSANRTVDETVLKVVASTSNVNMDIFEKEEKITVCALWDEVREEGKQEGRQEGKQEGKSEGANNLAKLIKKLKDDNRQSDADKVLDDENFRNEMFDEYGINN